METVNQEINPILVYQRDLNSEDLAVINQFREIEFDSKRPIESSPDSVESGNPWFLLRKGEEIVAFGQLHDLKVEFEGELYEVLGIASIVAKIKGNGYGKELMVKIREYIETTGKTAIGFCVPSNSAFYEKSGFSIIKGGINRFNFPSNANTVSSSKPEEDVIYFEGQDRLITKMCENKDSNINTFRKQW